MSIRGIRRISAVRLYSGLAVFYALLNTPAVAQNDSVPLSPLSPQNMAECDQLQSQWDNLRQQLETEHQSCLDAHSNEPSAPNSGSGPGSTCSHSECQSLHNAIYSIVVPQSQSTVQQCRSQVTQYQQQQQQQQAATQQAEQLAQQQLQQRISGFRTQAQQLIQQANARQAAWQSATAQTRAKETTQDAAYQKSESQLRTEAQAAVQAAQQTGQPSQGSDSLPPEAQANIGDASSVTNAQSPSDATPSVTPSANPLSQVGVEGPAGPQGTSGVQGQAGATAAQGPEGNPGQQGATGTTAATGSQGVAGATETTGTTGDPTGPDPASVPVVLPQSGLNINPYFLRGGEQIAASCLTIAICAFPPAGVVGALAVGAGVTGAAGGLVIGTVNITAGMTGQTAQVAPSELAVGATSNLAGQFGTLWTGNLNSGVNAANTFNLMLTFPTLQDTYIAGHPILSIFNANQATTSLEEGATAIQNTLPSNGVNSAVSPQPTPAPVQTPTSPQEP
jgi:hypothetical protein